jgi:hypothetical protein
MVNDMAGQWSFRSSEDPVFTVRVDLEDRGQGCTGRAYVFYPGSDLPGLQFNLQLPKEAPFRAELITIYLYPSGGAMTYSERLETEKSVAERHGQSLPEKINAKFSIANDELEIVWSSQDGRGGSIKLEKSDTKSSSIMVPRADIKSWEQFRQWSVNQKPRNYIFRGQRKQSKLVTSFHRSWRSDIGLWISDDVSRLYGAVAERLTYPLQIGNMLHNSAIWSIMQHHGYPTPLLDWSMSPFVAAYFAFKDADNDGSAPRIFIFDQMSWNKRYGRDNLIVDCAPDQLVVIESMGASNPRHTPQQAISTVTNVADVEELIRRRERDDDDQYLTVCDLPADSRPQIMRELELMGITYGSLFPGLDGICRDMRDRLS